MNRWELPPAAACLQGRLQLDGRMAASRRGGHMPACVYTAHMCCAPCQAGACWPASHQTPFVLHSQGAAQVRRPACDLAGPGPAASSHPARCVGCRTVFSRRQQHGQGRRCCSAPADRQAATARRPLHRLSAYAPVQSFPAPPLLAAALNLPSHLRLSHVGFQYLKDCEANS